MHDQEDAFESSNFIEVDNYTITSYSANSLTIGISKTAMAQVFYGKFNYMKNSNLYFDVLFKVSGTETYKKNISVNEFEIADGLDLFDYRKGWRIGYESRTNNSTFNFLSLYSAIEVGVMPVPKYTPSSGFYFLLRFGIMFYRTVG